MLRLLQYDSGAMMPLTAAIFFLPDDYELFYLFNFQLQFIFNISLYEFLVGSMVVR